MLSLPGLLCEHKQHFIFEVALVFLGGFMVGIITKLLPTNSHFSSLHVLGMHSVRAGAGTVFHRKF